MFLGMFLLDYVIHQELSFMYIMLEIFAGLLICSAHAEHWHPCRVSSQ
ncbi:hypothetical protein SLEP1_g32299 [Rubroshorea leprosula]|uniref:Uncharacterized protein n=1 Tax=Rubroshorea leprosula TaxID=152421 RepID=A0AAV5KCX0_9ROSI|nr:hypothetical protein SLEP1_g32299 [Rubroshorea leprosula]